MEGPFLGVLPRHNTDEARPPSAVNSVVDCSAVYVLASFVRRFGTIMGPMCAVKFDAGKLKLALQCRMPHLLLLQKLFIYDPLQRSKSAYHLNGGDDEP